MTEPPRRTTRPRLADAVNEMIARVRSLTDETAADPLMLERIYRVRDGLTTPVVLTLRKHGHAGAAEAVEAYYRAAEEYVVCFRAEPEQRTARRKRVEGLERRVRRTLLGKADIEGQVEKLLDDVRQWQWKTTLDENGRIAFAGGSGAAVPARSHILQKVGPSVIEQAVKAQKPYADDVRPRDLHGDPGGLLVLRDAKRLLVIGDLHGRYDNLEHILQDGDNLRAVIEGRAHLVFMGDAVHPPGARVLDDAAYEESFCVMLLIMTLKAENPFNVHYILGNHDNAHVGGSPLMRGKGRPDLLFEEYFSKKVSASVVEGYREFVRNCPVTVRVHAPGGALLLVHSTFSGQLIDEEALINIFVNGRKNGLLEDLLWSRQYDAAWIQRGAAAVGAKLVIGGHTIPRERAAAALGFRCLVPSAFGHVGTVQLILDCQGDVAGYLDVDLTRPLPDDVAALSAPDGHSALRVIRPRNPTTPRAAEGE